MLILLLAFVTVCELFEIYKYIGKMFCKIKINNTRNMKRLDLGMCTIFIVQVLSNALMPAVTQRIMSSMLLHALKIYKV